MRPRSAGVGRLRPLSPTGHPVAAPRPPTPRRSLPSRNKAPSGAAEALLAELYPHLVGKVEFKAERYTPKVTVEEKYKTPPPERV